jgi:hypothetical protein
MNTDTKVRIVVMLVSATLPVLAATLAVHGISIAPLDEIGWGPH